MKKRGFLGIDVSKGYADFLLLDDNDQILEAGFQLYDNKPGRQKLTEIIVGWQQHGLEELYCGVESTGGYENNWYWHLKSSFPEGQVNVCRINPRGVKAVGDASLKRTITDAVSAEIIASYMIRFPQKLDYGLKSTFADVGFKDGRQHLTCINMHKKQKVQVNNQLEKLLYQHFAEILVYCRHGMPTWLLTMLMKYPSAAMVAKAGVAKLTRISGISEAKAKSIVSKAQENMQPVSAQICHVIQIAAGEVLHKDELIRKEKKYLTDLYRGSEEVKLLTSIQGIGVDSAVMIALEIEDVNRFATPKKMASFFGVHPTFKQSGDGKWGNHMSKAGRSDLRAALYMPSLTATRYNPLLKQIYARFRAKGMSHYQAIGVVMHKLLRIIYGLLKRKTQFNSETDLQNQRKATEKQHTNEQKSKEEARIKKEKKHRFQPASTKAPISRRKEQKLKKEVASQTSF